MKRSQPNPSIRLKGVMREIRKSLSGYEPSEAAMGKLRQYGGTLSVADAGVRWQRHARPCLCSCLQIHPGGAGRHHWEPQYCYLFLIYLKATSRPGITQHSGYATGLTVTESCVGGFQEGARHSSPLPSVQTGSGA